VLVRTLRRTLPVREHLSVAFALGIFVFFLGMFVGGLLGLYKPFFFVLLPFLLLAAGAVDGRRYASRLVRHLRHRRRTAPPVPPWLLAVSALGLVGVGMVYFSILTPDNVAFDSRWYHLGIAEHYVAQGSLRRFPEGWYPGTSPHLASFLYTWAYLMPSSSLFDKVELCAHVEFVVFLATLAAIPALVRLLVPGSRGRGTWAARFLFPGIFLYDSSLTCGADHIAALFAVPIFTTLVRAWRDLSPRTSGLLAAMLAGAFMTKYTGALNLMCFPMLAVAVRPLLLAGKSLLRREVPPVKALLAGPGVAVAAGLVLTAPQWLKNWVWYGDPVYPLMPKRFSPHPWTADAADRFAWFVESQLWKPTRDWAGVKDTVKAMFTYSFIPNDWPKFHGAVPTFGSLFTLTLFCLPFLRGAKRLWALFLAAHVGLFVWYSTHHQDRYL
jgi:hypothetical protein